MNSKPLYKALASNLLARQNCEQMGNKEWFDRWTDTIAKLIADHMPHGSGFDGGVRLDWNKSTPNELVFHTAFHHMNEDGYYDGWTSHDVIVSPSLVFDIELKITGRDRNDIKEHIHEAFSDALGIEVTS